MKRLMFLLLASASFCGPACGAGITVSNPEDFPAKWKLNPAPTKGVAEYREIEEKPGSGCPGNRFVYLKGHLSYGTIKVSEGDGIRVSFYSRSDNEESRVSVMLYTYHMHPVEKRLKWTGALASPSHKTSYSWKEINVSITIPGMHEGYSVDAVTVALISSEGGYLAHAGVFHELKGGLWQKHFEEGRKVYTRDSNLASGFMRPAIDFGMAKRHFGLALEEARTDEEKAASLIAIGEMQLYDQNETDCRAVRKTFERVFELPSANPENKALAYLGIGETYLRENNYTAARQNFADAKKACGSPSVNERAELLVAFSYMQERNYPAAREKLNRLIASETLARTVKDVALDYLTSIEQLPLIKKSRPRLFFNESTWPLVKARALREEKEYFDKIRKEVEKMELWEIGQDDYGITLMKAAFVYRITGDELLLEKIRKMFRSTLDCYLARKNNDHTRSYSRVCTVSALDWLWEYLSPAERDSFASDLLFYAYSMYLEDKIQGRLDRHFVYYVQDMFWYTGAALLDESLDDVAYSKVMCLLGHGYRQEQMMFESMLKASGDDGAWQVKLDYAFGHQPTVFWAFMHCIQSALGKEIPEEWIHIVNPDYVLRNFLGFEGKGIRQFGYDRSWGTKTVSANLMYDHLSHVVHFFGKSQPGYAAVALHLRKQIEENIGWGVGEHPVNPFLWTGLDRVAPGGVPDNMPVARHFENAGLLFMSSGFTPEDTYVLFSCGGGTANALHYDATHFSIYKKGYLALDSGTGNPEHSAHTVNYAMQTVAHNAVLIDMPGERCSGGQSRTTKSAKILAFETSPYFSYAATDATENYSPEKCRQMVRQFIYLNPDHFLVFDRVISAKAEYSKKWLLHTSNEPLVSGTEFSADQGEGRIFCRTLYPVDAGIEKIGGPGKEFWDGKKNWPIESHFTRERMNGSEDVTETLGRWRVEVSTGSVREEDVFLHLIQVTDRNVGKMAESKVSEKDGKIFVSFSSGGMDYDIILNKTGEIGGHVKIADSGKIFVNRMLIRNVMGQKGLALQE